MRTSVPGNKRDVAPTLAHCVWPLPPKGAQPAWGGPALRLLTPTLAHCVWPLPPEGELPCLGRPGAAAVPSRNRGFTLLELMVVVAIIAIASAGVTFAMRDSAQTALTREAERLTALLEAGRALSRASGQALRWRVTDSGFRFEGPNGNTLPQNWVAAPQAGQAITVLWPPGATQPALVLGPEPIIEAQSFTLAQEGRSVRIATDGLKPFALQDAPTELGPR